MDRDSSSTVIFSSNPLSPDPSKENENEIKNEPDPNPSSSPTEQPPKEENTETDDHPKIDDPNKFQDVSEIRRAISLHNIWKVKKLFKSGIQGLLGSSQCSLFRILDRTGSGPTQF